MTEWAWTIVKAAAILIAAPIVGGLLTGIDRKITAKMQSRKGPPLLQPFYDVRKLFAKEPTTVNPMTRYYVTFSLFFTAFSVVLFFLGTDILLSVFAFTLACVFFVIAGYSSRSPYAFVGTERELIQIMSYEPMVLIVAFGFYEVAGTFEVSAVTTLETPLIAKLPLIFMGLLYILTIKLRKSPFDLSMSHHGHQEIVKGITTEMNASCLAMAEITHWLETVFALGLTGIFFVTAAGWTWILAIGVTLLAFFLEILIDNTFARIKWKRALTVSWAVTAFLGAANLILTQF